MTTIRGFLRNTKQAIVNLDSDVKTAIKVIEQDLLDLNLEDQLFQGLDNKGRIIGVYSKATEEMTQGVPGKGFPKLAGRPYNFFDQGDVFRGTKYRFVNGDTLEIFSTDSKIPELEAKYGKDRMFGLTEPNQKRFNYDLLLPVLRGFIKRHYRA